MKMTEEVVAAIKTLKAACENDYERLTIERMEKAITEPPTVKVLDERRQEFNGKIYFRSRDGYYFTNYNLHVVLWETYHGEVPKGFQVHHGERGVDCNELSNLTLKTQSEHAKLHFDEGRAKLRETVRVCKYCGKEYHPKQNNQLYCCEKCQRADYYYNKTPNVKRICPVCGKEYEAKNMGKATRKTCSWVCSGKLARQKDPVTNRERDEKGRFK